MKLILNQGEVIQHQLAKLRLVSLSPQLISKAISCAQLKLRVGSVCGKFDDESDDKVIESCSSKVLNPLYSLLSLYIPHRDREIEITTIEEERHKLREKEHGKNYLLETYLKGLQCSSDDKQELAAGNSDSGVHTEETAASPEVQHEDEISDTLIPLGNEQKASTITSKKTRERRSKREHELMMEHQSMKNAMKKFDEAAAAAAIASVDDGDEKITENENADDDVDDDEDGDGKPINKEVAAQIDILERLIVLNKHLQREEELCVRLSAKIKRYEADASGLSEAQVKESLVRVNEQLDAKNCEISKMEEEIKNSDDTMSEKTDMLKKLYDDLEEAEVEHRKWEVTSSENMSIQIPLPMPAIKCQQMLTTRNEDLGMSREYLAENIYNISKMILKSSGTSMPMNMHNINSPVDSSTAVAADENSMSMVTAVPEKRIIQAQIHSIPTTSDQYRMADAQLKKHNIESLNYLATINQRIQKNQNPIEGDINIAKNPIIQATQHYKLAPKKLLMSSGGGSSAFTMESRNNSNILRHNVMFQPQPNDNCINSIITQDVSQLGTLV